jgi:hypothetical protein
MLRERASFIVVPHPPRNMTAQVDAAGSAAMNHATVAYTRPEDRRRSEAFTWADSLPDWFRSEAFAEDLDGPAEAPPRAEAPAMSLHPGG